MPATLTPDAIDLEASRLYDTAAWRSIVSGWHLTAPEPAPRAATQATQPSVTSDGWRALLSKTPEELAAEALATIPPAPAAERPLPGRLAAVLPDRLQAWRRIGQSDVKPSVQLAYAREILLAHGWQNQPYKLRDARGARCLCGALLTAQRYGYGTRTTTDQSATWVVSVLRLDHQWDGLIGPWNRAPGRTQTDALALLTAAARRAALAGH